VGERAQNLACGITVSLLEEINEEMDKNKAAGVDGVRKEDFSEGITEKLENLVSRMKREAYKPQAVVQIPA